MPPRPPKRLFELQRPTPVNTLKSPIGDAIERRTPTTAAGDVEDEEMYSNCYALQHAGQKSAEVAGRDRRGPSSKFKTFAGDDPYAAEELFECGVSNEPSSVDLQRFATLEAEDLVFEEVAMMRHKESTFKGHDAGQESGKIQRGCPLRSSRKMPLRRSMMLISSERSSAAG